jgi:hypothetical protein
LVFKKIANRQTEPYVPKLGCSVTKKLSCLLKRASLSRALQVLEQFF